MTDLYVQARILYHLYTLERPIIQLQLQMDHLEYIDIEKVEKELDLLIQKGYVQSTEPHEPSTLMNQYQQQRLLNLSDSGKKRTELLYTNFVEYIKQNHPYMSHQINIFDTLASKPAELVRRIYHHIQDEPELKDAFKKYLEKDSI
jgi:hypothetical protein